MTATAAGFVKLGCDSCSMIYWECKGCAVMVENKYFHTCWVKSRQEGAYTRLAKSMSPCQHPPFRVLEAPSATDQYICSGCYGYIKYLICQSKDSGFCVFCQTSIKISSGYLTRAQMHQYRCPVLKERGIPKCLSRLIPSSVSIPSISCRQYLCTVMNNRPIVVVRDLPNTYEHHNQILLCCFSTRSPATASPVAARTERCGIFIAMGSCDMTPLCTSALPVPIHQRTGSGSETYTA